MFEYKIENGEVTITGIKDKTVESIIIPKEIDGYPVTNIDNYALDCLPKVRNIIIPDSILNISHDTFANCRSLETINIPDSIINIGSDCLLGCRLLIKINNIKLNKGINIINNRFIYHNTWVCKILNQIGNDYYHECYGENGYFIDNIEYGEIFNRYR